MNHDAAASVALEATAAHRGGMCNLDNTAGEVREVLALLTVGVLIIKWFVLSGTSAMNRTGMQHFHDFCKLMLASFIGHVANGWAQPRLPTKNGGLDGCQKFQTLIIINCTIGSIIVFMVFSSCVSIIEYLDNVSCCKARGGRMSWKKYGLQLVDSKKTAVTDHARALLRVEKGRSEHDDESMPLSQFGSQMVFWALVVIIARLITYSIIWQLVQAPSFIWIGTHFVPGEDHPWSATFVVPTLMNAIQFLVLDEVLAHDWLESEKYRAELGHDDGDKSVDDLKEEIKRTKGLLLARQLEEEYNKVEPALKAVTEAQGLLKEPPSEMPGASQGLQGSKDEQRRFWTTLSTNYKNVTDKSNELARHAKDHSKTVEEKLKRLEGGAATVRTPVKKDNGCSIL